MDLKNNLNTIFLNEHSIQKYKDKNYQSLYLLKYKKDNEEFKYYNVPSVMQCRGIILEEYSNKIICYSLDKFEKQLENIDINEFTIEEAIDGTQIRLYYYNNEWIVATTRTINAKNSKWNYVKTFYDLFKDVEHLIDYSKLNKLHTYTFILKHIENRIISNVSKNELIHIHTRNNESLLEIDEDIGVPKPKMYSFDSFEDLKKDLEQFDFETKGYVLKCHNKRYMYKTINYEYVSKLKGNHLNISYHYLDLLKNNKLTEFLEYFPEYKIKFDLVNSTIKELSKHLQNIYYNKHVKKLTNYLIPFNYKTVIYELHGNYLNDKIIVTNDVVREYLNNIPINKLVNLISYYTKVNKKDKKINN